MPTSSEFDRVIALELGAGTGMLGSAAFLNMSGDTVPKNLTYFTDCLVFLSGEVP